MEQIGQWMFIVYKARVYFPTIVRTTPGDFYGGPVEVVNSLDRATLEKTLLRRVEAGMPHGTAPANGMQEILAATGAKTVGQLRNRSAQWSLGHGARGVGLGRDPRSNKEEFEWEEYPSSIPTKEAVRRIVEMALDYENS